MARPVPPRNGRHATIHRTEVETVPSSVPAEPPGRVLIEPRTIWLAAAVFGGLILSWVVISRTVEILLLLFLAVIFAEGIRPVVDRLSSRFLPRPVAVLLIYLVLLAVAAFLVWLLTRPILREATYLANHMPSYVNEIQHRIGELQRRIGHQSEINNALGTLQGQVAGGARQVAFLVLHLPLTVGTVVFKALEVLFMAFFWLTSGPGMKRFVLELMPDTARATASDTLAEMGDRLGGYLRGTLINMVVVGLATGITLWLLHIPYPVLLGILAGLMEVLPLIGTFVGQAAAIAVALVSSGPLTAGEVWFATMLIQQAEGNVLVPLVMQRAVDVSPLVVTMSILMGGSLFGIMGAVVAVPLAVVLKVLLVRVLAPAFRRSLATTPRPSVQLPGSGVAQEEPRLP